MKVISQKKVLKTRMMKYLTNIFLLLSFFARSQNEPETQKKWSSEYGLEIETENQLFFNEGLYNHQRQLFVSGALKPNYSLESANKMHKFYINLFYRVSASDPNRSHFDIREAFYRFNKNDWSISIGSKKVFWGVTELAHLVDVINQTDFLEGFDGEQKLGQPMIQFTISKKIGNIEAYYLPIARRLSFPSKFGRYRFPEVIERNDIPFRNSKEEWYPSFALRWSKTIADIDFGLSAFHGTAREPVYLGFNPQVGLDLSYPIMNQFGLDLLYVFDNWIFKLEAINRKTNVQEFNAFTSGSEYTFGNVVNTGTDIGIVSEYMYDSRGLLTFSGLDNDIFIGCRFAFNDTKSTEMLVGTISDTNKSTKIFSLEGSRRIGSSYKLNLKANVLSSVSQKELIYNFRQDDFFQISISKFF